MIWKLLGLWPGVFRLLPLASVLGVLLAVIEGTSWLVAPLLTAPLLAVRTLFDCGRWSCRVTQPVQRNPLWPASWFLAVDKSRGPKSVEVRRVWEVHDDRLQFMSRDDALQFDEALVGDDVSRAWLVWSGAAETALVDAYHFLGPCRGLILERVRLRCSELSGLVDTRFGRHEVMLLTRMMLLMSSYVVTPLLLTCLT